VHPIGGKPKKKLLGRILKDFFAGDKTKLVYFAEGNDLFSQIKINQVCGLFSLK
jgi:hypothetical protein